MLSFSLHMEGKPIPKGRPRLGKRSTYTPEKTRVYEKTLRNKAIDMLKNSAPYPSAVRVSILVKVKTGDEIKKPMRESAYAGKIRPTKRPDIDNIAKTILDALNGVVFRDDSQVVELFASKAYNDKDEVFITVTSI